MPDELALLADCRYIQGIAEPNPNEGMPPHPLEARSCTLAPNHTRPLGSYLSPLASLYLLASAGYAVYHTAAPLPGLTEREARQHHTVVEGYWIVDSRGRARHFRHFWSRELDY